MTDTRAEEWLKRAETADRARENMFILYDAIGEIFYPERADFLAQQSMGLERTTALMTTYPSKMRYDLANAFGSMMRMRGKEWFRSTIFPRHLNDDQEVAEYCDARTEAQRDITYAPGTNFARAMRASDNDYVAFGTSVVTTTYNRRRDGLLYSCVHPKQISFEENAEGAADIVYDQPKYTARQIGQLFGEKGAQSLPEAIRKAIEKEPGKEIALRRVVLPIDEYEFRRGIRKPPGARYVSLYIDPETRTVLRGGVGQDEALFYTSPYLIRRWFTVSGEAWARSPCTMLALADARMSQKLRRALVEAIEKAVDPPMLVRNDGVLGDLNFYAGGVTFARRSADYKLGRPVEAIDTGAQPQYGLELESKVLEFLQACFLQNVLTLPRDRAMTAAEVSERIEEFIRTAAPVFEPMEEEHALLMERSGDLSERAGAFGERPDAIQGADVRHQFDTPLSSALDKLRVYQAREAIELTAQIAQLDPGAPKRVNWKEVQRDAMKGIGPARWWRPDEEADQEIADEDEKMQAAQLLQMAKETGVMDAMGQGAMEGGDPAAMAGGAPGGPPGLPAPEGIDPAALMGAAA